MRFMRFSVCVNHGSTLELKTTLTEDALGAKAAAEAGSNCGGIEEYFVFVRWDDNPGIERLKATKDSWARRWRNLRETVPDGETQQEGKE